MAVLQYADVKRTAIFLYDWLSLAVWVLIHVVFEKNYANMYVGHNDVTESFFWRQKCQVVPARWAAEWYSIRYRWYHSKYRPLRIKYTVKVLHCRITTPSEQPLKGDRGDLKCSSHCIQSKPLVQHPPLVHIFISILPVLHLYPVSLGIQIKFKTFMVPVNMVWLFKILKCSGNTQNGRKLNFFYLEGYEYIPYSNNVCLQAKIRVQINVVLLRMTV